MLVILFLNCGAKWHFIIILRILLKIPAIWYVVVVANCEQGRQSLLKVVWRLELREQLGTFVISRLLTQNDGQRKKILTGMKRGEKNRRAGRQKNQLWPLKTDCSAVLLWGRCMGTHNSTQGLIQFVKKNNNKKTQHDKNPGPGAGYFLLVLHLRRHLLLYLYHESAHTALSLTAPAPLSLQNCRKMLTIERIPPRGNRGRCCPCQQFNMIHITNCSLLRIPGRQLFVDLVAESQVRGIYSISRVLQALPLKPSCSLPRWPEWIFLAPFPDENTEIQSGQITCQGHRTRSPELNDRPGIMARGLMTTVEHTWT